MNIEQKIGKVTLSSILSVGSWRWFGEPFSINMGVRVASPLVNNVWYNIDKLIFESTTEECLTSPSEYIRESKKWFQNHPQVTFP